MYVCQIKSKQTQAFHFHLSQSSSGILFHFALNSAASFSFSLCVSHYSVFLELIHGIYVYFNALLSKKVFATAFSF